MFICVVFLFNVAAELQHHSEVDSYNLRLVFQRATPIKLTTLHTYRSKTMLL